LEIVAPDSFFGSVDRKSGKGVGERVEAMVGTAAKK
jgi:hypothetical protein